MWLGEKTTTESVSVPPGTTPHLNSLSAHSGASDLSPHVHTEHIPLSKCLRWANQQECVVLQSMDFFFINEEVPNALIFLLYFENGNHKECEQWTQLNHFVTFSDLAMKGIQTERWENINGIVSAQFTQLQPSDPSDSNTEKALEAFQVRHKTQFFTDLLANSVSGD